MNELVHRYVGWEVPVSDLEQLAARLVEAAGKATHTADDFGRDTWASSPQDEQRHFIRMGSAAAIAVLRELEKDAAADLEVAHKAAHRIADKYRGLADFIEKGTADDHQ